MGEPAVSALVFLDTETTGLSLYDDIWEFAAIRRDPDGTETELHLFLEHDVIKCKRLPESFRADHERRFPATHHGGWHPDVVRKFDAADIITDFLNGRPHIVGAVPNFDTERIARLCEGQFHDWKAPWHYHLIDVENLAVGYLRGQVNGEAEGGTFEYAPPWDSDVIATALGVTISDDERHTAMGDVRWAMRIYDAVMQS
jgi:hypothetical protein